MNITADIILVILLAGVIGTLFSLFFEFFVTIAMVWRIVVRVFPVGGGRRCQEGESGKTLCTGK